MFKSFFSGPSDQTTPKAGQTERANPFESVSSSAANTPSSSRRPTATQQQHSPSLGGGGGAKTPTSQFSGTGNGMGMGGSTTPSTSTAPHAPPKGGYFASAEHQASAVGSATPLTPGGLATTAVSMSEPDFSFKTQPGNLARKRDAGTSPRGKLNVKLISARGLSAISSTSRPYVVVTFDQNEFVSREPIHEEEGVATGTAATRNEELHNLRRELPAPNQENGHSHRNKLSRVFGAAKSPPTKSPAATTVSLPSEPSQLSPPASSPYDPIWKHEVDFDVMSERSLMQVQIFDRSLEEERFLGLTEVRPRLVPGFTVDQWFPLSPRAEGEGEVTGEIRIQISYEKYDVKKGLSPKDFDFLRMIGRGTFGRVFQVRKKDTHRIYAMKVLSKSEIVAKKEVAHTIGERKILQKSSDNPFLLGLKFSFQTETDLYLVMDYKSGGELFHHLQREGRFTEDRARFYIAEIILAFEHLHKYDIVYRDLKPENILLDATGHIVLCDFGLSKPDLPSDALTNTFCGTTEYLAPEVLLDDHGYSKPVDYWALGVLTFEMVCGWSPFYAEDTQQMYKLICFGKVKFPRGVMSEDGKQFVKALLNRNPKHRLGSQRGAEELKEHPFFKNIDWELLAARQVPPPFKPFVDSDESVANFDPEFTEANIWDEVPQDAMLYDDNDPSADWLDAASSSMSNNKQLGRTPSQAQRQRQQQQQQQQQVQQKSGAVEIRGQGKRPPTAPLSTSMQENFRGFTFSGENDSMIHQAAHKFGMTSLDDNGGNLTNARRTDSPEPALDNDDTMTDAA